MKVKVIKQLGNYKPGEEITISGGRVARLLNDGIVEPVKRESEYAILPEVETAVKQEVRQDVKPKTQRKSRKK